MGFVPSARSIARWAASAGASDALAGSALLPVEPLMIAMVAIAASRVSAVPPRISFVRREIVGVDP
jgi:hypothetical protein